MSLRSFLERKEVKNQIIRMKEEVSPHFEISSIMKHFDQNGPILFFEKVKGRTNSVVANVCGTRGRLCTALDIEPEQLYNRLAEA